ncbi:DUF72 domain-containing protein [bacterium]|nr:DUF72 domain-containing protein [bacterium]
MAELRIGTCSWKFPSWHKLVYSEPKGINYLEEYSRHYNTVEIDQWFWSLCSPGFHRSRSRQTSEFANLESQRLRVTKQSGYG